jgi:hypothetical protein
MYRNQFLKRKEGKEKLTAKRLNAIKACIQTPHYLTRTSQRTVCITDGWSSFWDWSQSQNYIARPPFELIKYWRFYWGLKVRIGVDILWLNRGKSLRHQSVSFLTSIQLSLNSEIVVTPMVLSKLHTSSWKLEVSKAVTMVIETQILLQKETSSKQGEAALQA